MKTKEITRGSICWLHFHNQGKPGHTHCGDYGSIKGVVPDHSKKIEDDELYVKVAVKDIDYRYGHINFHMEVLDKKGIGSYSISINEPDRLSPFDWKYPEQISWSVLPSYLYHLVKLEKR